MRLCIYRLSEARRCIIPQAPLRFACGYAYIASPRLGADDAKDFLLILAKIFAEHITKDFENDF